MPVGQLGFDQSGNLMTGSNNHGLMLSLILGELQQGITASGGVSYVDSANYNLVADGTTGSPTDNTAQLQKAINDAANSASRTLLLRQSGIVVNGTLTNGSASITGLTAAQTANIYVGMYVAGQGIGLLATVSSVSNTSVVINFAAIVGSGVTLTTPITFIGSYGFAGTLTIPPSVSIIGESSPGDTNGYIPWYGALFKVRLQFTGTSNTALYIPWLGTNLLQDFELAGSVSAVGTGICFQDDFATTGATHSNNTLTVNGPFGRTPQVGDVIDPTFWTAGDLPFPFNPGNSNLVAGATTFTVPSTSGIAVGMAVMDYELRNGAQGPGEYNAGRYIASGSRVTHVDAGTMTITISKPILSSNSNTTPVGFWNTVTAFDGVNTITMSNPATGSNSSTALSGAGSQFLHFIDPLYMGPGGQGSRLNRLYVHDFGVNLGIGFTGRIDVEYCYFGNAQYANVCSSYGQQSRFKYCYIGGDSAPTYPTALGVYAIQGWLDFIQCQINKGITALYATNGARITADVLAFEAIGPTAGQGTGSANIELRNTSTIIYDWLNNNVIQQGGIGIRATGGSTVFGNNFPNVTGPAAIAGTLTGGSSTIAMASTSGISVGWSIVEQTGSNIPPLSYITAVNPSSIVISQNCTGSASENLSAVPPSIAIDNEAGVDVSALGSSAFPLALIDPSTLATVELVVPGRSNTPFTHGDVASMAPYQMVVKPGSNLIVNPGASVGIGTLAPSSQFDMVQSGGTAVVAQFRSQNAGGLVLIALKRTGNDGALFIAGANAQGFSDMLQGDFGLQAFSNMRLGVGSGSSTVVLDSSGRILTPNMPTSDPHVAGALWSNSGVVTRSTG